MNKPDKIDRSADSGAPAPTAAMLAVFPSATRAWMEIMTEGARFMAERLQQDIETQKAMLACKSPADVMQVQTAFLTEAVKQYSGEAARLIRMMSMATGETMDDLRSGHSRSYDDVPL